MKWFEGDQVLPQLDFLADNIDDSDDYESEDKIEFDYDYDSSDDNGESEEG